MKVYIHLNGMSVTGFKRESVLNRISQYPVTSNDIADIVLDVAKGIANFSMAKIFNYYIQNDVINL